MNAADTCILVVDDDAALTRLLCTYLGRYGYATQAAHDGAQMRAQLATQRIDLIVLDLTLPDADGLALAHALRAESRVPIIMLTGRCTAADRIVGLEMGADDYMGKPFDPRELVARVQTVLRRSQAGAETRAAADRVRFDGWELHTGERSLTAPCGTVVPLSNAEYRLLSTFLRAPRRVVTRDQLMAQARGRAMAALDRSIDLLVSRLRQKLADAQGGNAMIKTVRGAGYLFDAQRIEGRAA